MGYNRESYRRWMAKNRDRKYAYMAKYFSLRQAFMDAAKAGGCVDCGVKNLNVLDLDHVRGEKVCDVSSMGTTSLKRLFEEIDKCETVCANCHRLRTLRRQGPRRRFGSTL